MSNLREDVAKLPVCPKPRRIRSVVPEFIEPLAYNGSHSKGKGSRSSEVIDMISSKADNGQEPSSNGCSPSYYCGSPPSRTNNPLVHDVQFIHQMKLLSPFTRTKLSDRLCLGSASSA
ncbi:hypothetical protein AAC387_Pa11g1203 [Persea americana]